MRPLIDLKNARPIYTPELLFDVPRRRIHALSLYPKRKLCCLIEAFEIRHIKNFSSC